MVIVSFDGGLVRLSAPNFVLAFAPGRGGAIATRPGGMCPCRCPSFPRAFGPAVPGLTGPV